MTSAMCPDKCGPARIVLILLVGFSMTSLVSSQSWNRRSRYNPWSTYDKHQSSRPVTNSHFVDESARKTFDKQSTGQLYVRVPGTPSHVVHGKPWQHDGQPPSYSAPSRTKAHAKKELEKTRVTDVKVYETSHQGYTPPVQRAPVPAKPPNRPTVPLPRQPQKQRPSYHHGYYTPSKPRHSYSSDSMRGFKNMDSMKSGRGSFHFKDLHGNPYVDRHAGSGHRYPSYIQHGSHRHRCEDFMKDPHARMSGSMTKVMCNMYFSWGDSMNKPSPMSFTDGQKAWAEKLGRRPKRRRQKRQASGGGYVDNRAIRREYRVMSDEERERFHTAVRRLKSTYMDGISKYDIVTGYHLAAASPGAHFGPAFLGYHRELLFRGQKASAM